MPLSPTGAELLFEVFSQRYERGSTLVTTNLPFDEWTEVFGSERLTGALLDRLTHHVHIVEMKRWELPAQGQPAGRPCIVAIAGAPGLPISVPADAAARPSVKARPPAPPARPRPSRTIQVVRF